MNHEKFSQKGDGFAFRGLRIEMEWKMPLSISFQICQHTEPNYRHVFGWLDVHETNEKYQRVKMRFILEHKYLRYAHQAELVETVCDELSLSKDSYDASFISPLKHISLWSSDTPGFISYGPPCPPDDNPWDDREGISALEVIPREKAYVMLLEAFPEFHRRMDADPHGEFMRSLGGMEFLDSSNSGFLIDAFEAELLDGEPSRLERVFALIEKLVIYGDDYTRHASLTRFFEMVVGRDGLKEKLKPWMQEKTLAALEKVKIESSRWPRK